MEAELLLTEDFLALINFLDSKSLTIHIDDEFLVGVNLILLERTYSDDDLDAVSLAGHYCGLVGLGFINKG